MKLVKDDIQADVVIIGGGLGGVASALSAAGMGLRVVMTEETDWIGGQLTSQAVPPDEHKVIETMGCTRTYREIRERLRAYYRANYPLTEQAADNPLLNPGRGWVSRLCHEPKVALRVLHDMLAPYTSSGRITILYETSPVEAETEGDIVRSVTVSHVRTQQLTRLRGSYFLDATECGDLLPLAGVEHVIGAESRTETGELHASEQANPLDIQSFTHVFAIDYFPEGNFTIEKPEQYDFWREYVPEPSIYPLLSMYTINVNDPTKYRKFNLFSDGQDPMPLWTYRRIIDKAQFEPGFYDSDITLVNWPQNDYYLGSIIGVSEAEKQKHLENAKQLSFSLLYWLQTEIPRPDGGKGYPGFRLRTDVLGTEDGMAKAPYIRESRRIKARYTITEADVGKEMRGEAGIRRYPDSIGVGSYHLDLHTTTVSHRKFYLPSYPYEIPLGALLPVRMTNILPVCKNIGTTQVSNGSYRLHPTEWNIGESAGYLVAYSLQHQVTPHQVYEEPSHLECFQSLIQEKGVQIHWPDGFEM
ncbi:FAD-dependent oxidoreductase [Paenibacillus dendritiformis]|uniref:FAD dependent oxidoreductase n=1 Tax=Paenibacillus dendritiformis C454 TaxID=1131935 RepID=H3SFT6_9BACL|nr:FAD-dependent oxidoreductase [Paenibacillus dendritiformis]EHQ62118.1 hypothetical protein PDENDC454_11955 [Paenibacillus dendritiformis C454]CAH8772875.1 FAD-dependent oxidoreductase [Paenibacillus dendritiformis]